MNRENRFLVFVVYFGEFPNYFDLTFESMKNNKYIDWFFITDQDIETDSPNIKLKKTSFEKYREFVQASFDFSISLNVPYKICDFRPAFGHIFTDSLQNYDFWGHCDLDVVFGDILSSIPTEAWNYDKVLLRGALSFYRNTKRINELYATNHADTLDSKVVFTSSKLFYFDEWHGVIQKFLKEDIAYWNDDSIYFDIDKNSFRIKTTNPKNNTRIRPKFMPDGEILMFDKSLDEEVQGAYIHFQKRRMWVSATSKKTDTKEIRFNRIVAVGRNRFRVDYLVIGVFTFLQLRFRAFYKKVFF
jgi:hypothetical protein